MATRTRPIPRRHEVQDFTLTPRPIGELQGVQQAVAINASSTVVTKSASIARTGTGPAKDSLVSATANGEVFKRFSAFQDDFRVTEGRGLTPGTFATTEEDARLHVRTGTEAVARYALQNKTPAKWRFTITPPERTNLQRGTVEPEFGEPGGGVEVIFVDGSPDGTVYDPDELPDK